MASSQVRWHQLFIIGWAWIYGVPKTDSWQPIPVTSSSPPPEETSFLLLKEESHISWSHALSSVTMPTSHQAFISGPGKKPPSVLSWQEPIFATCSYPMLVFKKFLVTFWSWQVRSQKFGTYFWLSIHKEQKKSYNRKSLKKCVRFKV